MRLVEMQGKQSTFRPEEFGLTCVLPRRGPRPSSPDTRRSEKRYGDPVEVVCGRVEEVVCDRVAHAQFVVDPSELRKRERAQRFAQSADLTGRAQHDFAAQALRLGDFCIRRHDRDNRRPIRR